MVAGGVYWQEAEDAGRYPPHPRQRATVDCWLPEAKFIQDRLSDGAPEPFQDRIDGVLGSVVARCMWFVVHCVGEGPVEGVDLIDKRVDVDVRQGQVCDAVLQQQDGVTPEPTDIQHRHWP